MLCLKSALSATLWFIESGEGSLRGRKQKFYQGASGKVMVYWRQSYGLGHMAGDATSGTKMRAGLPVFIAA